MKRFVSLVTLLVAAVLQLRAGEFTVMVYNVENLFDLDGVAVFGEYELAPAGDYGKEPLLNKLAGIHESLAAINDGRGPEVVMFQEFELDRTPFGGPDAEAFLELTRGCTLEELLDGKCDTGLSVANLPSELLLLKYLEDRGMRGYHIAQPDPFKSETHTPHKNVVFSRFPVRYIRQRPMLDARDLLVVGLDVEGHELVLLNNHWKSGASSTSMEPVRVQNARVVRAEVDAILYRNPSADLIVAGDLNCYYNQKAAFPGIPLTGINDIMMTHGFEERLLSPEETGLYNLWFELPAEERGSEVWQGKWGTLMQMLLTPGLYDGKGLQYVDNSFNRLILPGRNVESRWGRPVAWSNFGGGSGYSDHLPVYARFRVADGQPLKLDKPTSEAFSADRPKVDFRRMDRRAVPDFSVLEGLDDRAMAAHLGELFELKAPLVKARFPSVRVGDRVLQVYSPVQAVRDQLGRLSEGDLVKAMVEFDTYRGQLQFVILDESWLR